uniref:Uncharacterized protein n=1 Tax=Anguilla anguilla TaxID=7936 RepID=A0A0E9WZ74_ANGAN
MNCIFNFRVKAHRHGETILLFCSILSLYSAFLELCIYSVMHEKRRNLVKSKLPL